METRAIVMVIAVVSHFVELESNSPKQSQDGSERCSVKKKKYNNNGRFWRCFRCCSAVVFKWPKVSGKVTFYRSTISIQCRANRRGRV